MNLRMAGLDHSLAHLDLRQLFSFGPTQQKEIYAFLARQPDILGAVLLTTCNRTELYLSCVPDSPTHPFELLCRACGYDFSEWQAKCRLRLGDAVFVHLNRLACGAASQIWGEDQIITQVKEALSAAREEKAADSILEVLFRNGIAAAKAIKTRLTFTRTGQSAATKVLDVLQDLGRGSGHVLIIGNGEMARLTASLLLARGFAVSMTLRQYKHSPVPVPAGAATVPYSQRYAKMPDCDILVSATASPHCTVEKAPFAALPAKPSLLFDLAVPRDIDPGIADLPGITCHDIDTLGQSPFLAQQEAQLRQIDAIGQKYYADFLGWLTRRNLNAGSKPAAGRTP